MKSKIQKPIVLVFPFNLLSHYLRCLQLADAIRDDYDIYFARSDKYESWVEKAGFNTFSCDTFDPEWVMDCAKKFDFSWINERDLERILESQVACIRQLRPVAVLGDTAPTLKMAAEATRTPCFSLMNGYMTKYYKFVRKIAKAHPAAQFEEKLPPQLFEFMVKTGETFAFKQVHKPFKRLRKKQGLSKQRSYLDELEGDYNLICDLPVLFPQKNLPDNYLFLGPLFYRGNEKEHEIERFVDNGKYNILVSMGSSGDLEELAFLQNPDFANFNIVVAGDTNGVLTGPHILSKPFLNSSAIMSKMDLVFSHAGNGSIYQSLAFGVPLICKTSIFEQEWNLQGLAHLHLAGSLNGLETIEEIKNLVYFWMKKKGRPEFTTIRAKINLNESKRKFRQIFSSVIKPVKSSVNKSVHYERASYSRCRIRQSDWN